MILPHPESNLKINLMVLGADVIDIMSKSPFKNKFAVVDDIMVKFMKADKNRTPDLFLYSLTFLHLIGSIEKKGYKIRLVVNSEGNAFQQSLFN
ncbi:hypothetical protein FNW25_05015 [Flavobacterium franklandianum]|uniref:hypothetical protein n=1 Tax=Flavobacterium franklandianum TaxID=2594430 RepID=UPI001179BEFD|nr:hypothetical protein [Flavobacterium franklandianum]TRX27898.1 hypothetical protein FNW25_05015 [Flavobacterium franklandianum]